MKKILITILFVTLFSGKVTAEPIELKYATFEPPGPGFWALDRSHYPGGTTPISQWLIGETMPAGMRRVLAEVGVVVLADARRGEPESGQKARRADQGHDPGVPGRPGPPDALEMRIGREPGDHRYHKRQVPPMRRRERRPHRDESNQADGQHVRPADPGLNQRSPRGRYRVRVHLKAVGQRLAESV